MTEELKKKRRLWTQHDTRLLVDCYKKRKDECTRMRKKKLGLKNVLDDMRKMGLQDTTLTTDGLLSRVRILRDAYLIPSKLTASLQPFMKDMEEIIGHIDNSEVEFPEAIEQTFVANTEKKTVVETPNICRICFVSDKATLGLDTDCQKYLHFDEGCTFLDCYKYVYKLNGELFEKSFDKLCINCALELTNAYKFMRKLIMAEEIHQNRCEKQQLNKDPYRDSPADPDPIAVTDIKIEYPIEVDTHQNELLPLEEILKFNEVDGNSQGELVSIEEILRCNELKVDEEEMELDKEVLTDAEDELKESKENDMQNEPYKCFICSKIFPTISQTRKHVEAHKDARRLYSCDICNDSFILEESLLVHKDRHEKNYKCEICERFLSSQKTLETHMKTHANETVNAEEGPFSCDVCHKVYATKKSLDMHKKYEKKKLACEICGKKFGYNRQLIIHRRFHTRDFPYVCEKCGTKHATKSHLNMHVKVKHELLKLECQICQKTFSSRDSLQEHNYGHTGKFPYPCCYCKRAYTTRYKYKYHLKNTHQINPTDEEVKKSKSKCKPEPLQKIEAKWVPIDKEKNG